MLLAAQASPGPPADSAGWLVVEGGRQDSVQASGEAAVRDSVLNRLRRDGHYFATIDSVRGNGSGGGVVFAEAGPRYTLAEIEVEGAETIPSHVLLREIETSTGDVLDPTQLEADLDYLLRRLEEAGRPFATVEVAAVDLADGTDGGLLLRLRLQEGPQPIVRGFETEGATRTRSGYLSRVAGLREGEPLRNYDPDDLRARLEATGFYRSVGTPRLRAAADTGAVVVFPLEENPPGSFDLVLGFLPPTTRGESVGVVGNGHLELNNLFGAGRVVALRLNRLPGQTSSADVRVADPFIFGLPIGIEGQFSGLQQDSSYAKQRYGLEFGVRLTTSTHGFVTISRETTRPGVAANNAVSRADAWFAGVGVRVRRLDNVWNPTRGYVLEAAVESGRKQRAGLTGLGEGIAETQVDQERARFTARGYAPVRRRQVLVLGLDAAAVFSGVGDQSDLLRFGGATSLRGYDEDRFLARTAGRGLVEYRYLLDRTSFAFAFVDVGFVDAPALSGVAGVRGLYPGYGIGMRFETGVGLVSASYAISSEAGPTNGRVHVGLSFGL